jgi:hypothetical protein
MVKRQGVKETDMHMKDMGEVFVDLQPVWRLFPQRGPRHDHSPAGMLPFLEDSGRIPPKSNRIQLKSPKIEEEKGHW